MSCQLGRLFDAKVPTRDNRLFARTSIAAEKRQKQEGKCEGSGVHDVLQVIRSGKLYRKPSALKQSRDLGMIILLRLALPTMILVACRIVRLARWRQVK